MTDRNRELEAAVQDWKARGLSEAEIQGMAERLAGSAAMNPAQALKDRLDAIKAGQIIAILWPWPQVSELAPTLTPGSVTVLAGSPGASKSFLAVQALTYWTRRQVPCALLALEGSRSQHMQRLLAQLDENSNLVSLSWCKDHPEQVDAAWGRHREWLDVVGRGIHPAGIDATYDDILAWVKERGRRGDRVLVVDPITAANSQDKPWLADRRLIVKARQLAEASGLSLVLVVHPSKSSPGVTLDGLAGGAAFQRHTDGVLWLHACDAKTVTMMTPAGRFSGEIDRVVYLLKVRDGRGQGKAIGFRFEPKSLTFAEQGLIVKESKTRKESDSASRKD